jgi:hypothetical protein
MVRVARVVILEYSHHPARHHSAVRACEPRIVSPPTSPEALTMPVDPSKTMLLLAAWPEKLVAGAKYVSAAINAGDVVSGAYNVGAGAARVAEGDSGGWLDIGAGGLRVLSGGLGIRESLGPVRSAVAPVRTAGVQAYEVGTADALRARSLPGDALDIHHVGQAGPLKQMIPGYSRSTSPAIAVPEELHRTIPVLRGATNLTPRQVLARDIWNLRKYTDVPNSSLRELIELNKQMYPGAFGK